MKKSIWFMFSTLIVLATLLASCGGEKTPPTTQTTTTPTTATTATTKPTTPTTTTPATTPTSAPTTQSGRTEIRTAAPTITGQKDTPQYGGTLTVVEGYDITRSFDPYRMGFATGRMIGGTVLESLGTGDWAKGPAGTNEFSFAGYYVPEAVTAGDLAESWEKSADGFTLTVKLRKGVFFQNKAPVNGRELTADDIKFCWDRKLGIGAFKVRTPYPYEGMDEIASITVKDKYTVVFTMSRFNYVCSDFILKGYYTQIYPREVIDKYGDMEDWHNVIGTGPFLLTDYIANSSSTMTKNPNYYRYDEVHPQNRLPYVAEIKRLVIVDASTQIAAIRSYKADFFYYRGVDDYNKAELKKTMPDLQFGPGGSGRSYAVSIKTSAKPFDDLRVRQALQIGTDVKEMSTIIRGFPEEGYSSWMNADYGEAGGYIPFEKLPQDIKDLYKYDTEKAKKLLSDAGYPKGFTTEIWVTKDDDLSRYEILQNQWKKINVTLNIVLKDSSLTQTVAADRAFPQLLGSEMGSVSIETAFRSLDNIVNRPGGWSTPEGLKSFEMWKDITNTTDETQRVAKMKELNIYLLRNVISVPLLITPPTWSVGQSWIGGWYGAHQLRKHEPGTIFPRVWINKAKKQSLTR